MREISITSVDEGQRLDKYLAKFMPEAPKSFFYKMMRKKNIVLNGKKAAGMEKLAAGDVVKLFLADDTIDKFRGIAGAEKQYISKADTTSKKQRVKLDIIFEDEDILVVNKPVDMLSQKAEKLGADYIGAGAVFNTSTKKDTKPLELSTLKEICSSISIPVVAIGGIDHSNVRKLKGTDIDGVAVISALFGASDPGEATRELVSIMKDVVQ